MSVSLRPDTMSTANVTPIAATPRRATLLMGLLVVVVTSVILGAAEASHYQIVVLALAAAAAIAAFACVRPDIFGIALVAMLFVPYTWSPTVRNATTPLIVLFALPAGFAAAATLVHRGQLRLCVFDYLVTGLFVSVLLSELATLSGTSILGTSTLSHNELELILLPYFAFRLILTAWPRVIPKLPNALILTGAGLSLVAVWEELNRVNLFAHSSLNNPQLAVWEVSYPRAGAIRVDATMGHPIAFGSFLLIPIVFAFAQRRWRLFALLALAEALTLSRGPYIAVIVALSLYSVLTGRMGRLFVLLTVVVTLALFISPVRNSVTNSFQTGTSEQTNANYRWRLLGTSLSSLTPWGKPTEETSELFGRQGQFALPDVTSELALLSGTQGALGFALWVGLLAAFIYAIREARRRSDQLLLLLGVTLVGEWVALLSVALITSFQYVFWLTVAMTAARLSLRPRRAGAPTPIRQQVGEVGLGV